MKIVIDISKDRYDEIMSMDWKNCRRFFDEVFNEEIRAIHDGKALEQEPCTDTISRKAVLDIITEQERLARDRVRDTPSSLGHGLHTWVNPAYTKYSAQLSERSQFKTMIQTLPPVTPQPKTGHWYIDERPESDREVICSNCEQPIFKYHKMDFDYRPKYCPNCGAKMVEPQESEG